MESKVTNFFPKWKKFEQIATTEVKGTVKYQS